MIHCLVAGAYWHEYAGDQQCGWARLVERGTCQVYSKFAYIINGVYIRRGLRHPSTSSSNPRIFYCWTKLGTFSISILVGRRSRAWSLFSRPFCTTPFWSFSLFLPGFQPKHSLGPSTPPDFGRLGYSSFTTEGISLGDADQGTIVLPYQESDQMESGMYW